MSAPPWQSEKISATKTKKQALGEMTPWLSIRCEYLTCVNQTSPVTQSPTLLSTWYVDQ